MLPEYLEVGQSDHSYASELGRVPPPVAGRRVRGDARASPPVIDSVGFAFLELEIVMFLGYSEVKNITILKNNCPYMSEEKKVNWQPTKAEYWHKLSAPARPWSSEVDWFEKYTLDKKKEGKKDVLILGSTVEFRSMLHKNEMNVHVADFSKEFYKILSETQEDRLEHTGEEEFYEANWLTMDLGKKFDLIFGDWVPGVLHTKEYDIFYKQIEKHLKEDGLFIGRECLRPNRNILDMQEVLDNHYTNHADNYSLYESSLHFIYGYRMNDEDMWGMKSAIDAIEEANDKGCFKDEEDYVEIRDALSIEQEASASIMVKEDFENKAQEHLDIIAEHHVEEPSSQWFPIYVMKKK